MLAHDRHQGAKSLVGALRGFARASIRAGQRLAHSRLRVRADFPQGGLGGLIGRGSRDGAAEPLREDIGESGVPPDLDAMSVHPSHPAKPIED